jgi:hypothetical protein
MSLTPFAASRRAYRTVLRLGSSYGIRGGHQPHLRHRSQAERFVVLFSGDTQAAIDAVNAEEQNPSACALVDVAYLRGAEIGMARSGDSAFAIVRILVVGVDTAAGIQAVRPTAYFSLFAVKEYAV